MPKRLVAAAFGPSSPPSRLAGPSRQADPERWTAGAEPSIAELLNDPITAMVMRRDGIDRSHAISALRLARTNLRAGPGADGRPPAPRTVIDRTGGATRMPKAGRLPPYAEASC